MNERPSVNGGNGHRSPQGRFTKGNPGGPGNPHVQQSARFRSLILEAVAEDDLRAIVGALVEKAKGGDVIAARELFNRLVGRPADTTDLDRQELERRKIEVARLRLEVQEELAFEKLYDS